MSKDFLGEFEEVILILTAALGKDAYGAMIAEEIESKMKRTVKISAVHVTLYRLEDKGMLTSEMGGSTNERGGRRKRIYSVTDAGMAALRDIQEKRLMLWNMVPNLKIS